MNILYVEDGSMDADSARSHLQKQSPTVTATHAGSLEEALSFVADGDPCDLLLTKLALPDGMRLDRPGAETLEGKGVAPQERRIENQKVEAMGMLTNGVAHDLNNVLAGIAGYIELARDDLPEDSPVQEHMKMMERAIQSGSELCRQMLAYSGDDSVHHGRFNLNDLVHENSRLIDISTKQGTVLSLELAPQLPAVNGDGEKLKQVLLNLVLNAAGAINEDQGRIFIRTGLMEVTRDFLSEAKAAPGLPPGDYVFLEVEDSGPSIATARIPAVFDPTFPIRSIGRRLSLAAVHDAVISAGGAISVRTGEKRGLAFRVVLPLADQND